MQEATRELDWELSADYEEGIDPLTGNYSKGLILDQVKIDTTRHAEAIKEFMVALKEQHEQLEAILVGIEQDEYSRVLDVLDELDDSIWITDINEYAIARYCHQEIDKRKVEDN